MCYTQEHNFWTNFKQNIFPTEKKCTPPLNRLFFAEKKKLTENIHLLWAVSVTVIEPFAYERLRVRSTYSINASRECNRTHQERQHAVLDQGMLSVAGGRFPQVVRKEFENPQSRCLSIRGSEMHTMKNQIQEKYSNTSGQNRNMNSLSY